MKKAPRYKRYSKLLKISKPISYLLILKGTSKQEEKVNVSWHFDKNIVTLFGMNNTLILPLSLF